MDQSCHKATLHEHLAQLHEAGLVKKKEREGHKWVYYKLTWKGEGLLHPENTRIVVMFSVTFVSLFVAFMFLVSFLQPITVGMAETIGDTTYLYEVEDEGIPLFTRSYNYNYLAAVNATNQTVEYLTFELQNKSRHKLGMASSYDDITWVTPSQAPIDSKQYLLHEYYLENYYDNVGKGMIGELEKEIDELAFLKKIKSVFKTKVIKHTKLRNKNIKKVAVCGGSGSNLIKSAVKAGADIFITGDIKYHEARLAQELNLTMIDIGHFASEIIILPVLAKYLKKEICGRGYQIKVLMCNKERDPFNYL